MFNQADNQSSASHHHRLRHHQNRFLTAASRLFTNRSAILILLVISFLLGYLSRSHPLLALPADDILYHNSFPQSCADRTDPPEVRRTILQRVFNNSSHWQGFPPAYAKPLLFQQWTKGWGSQNPVFEHLIRQARPKVVIEVGTFLGASAIHMAGLLKNLGMEETLILCIDDFRG